ncbi:uncharacterized protein LOC110103833 [Dendrobium catenatum]|uniref:uncharacterized protein LOC110103833 n=1 Tax=Dendrobium catenatum TaxID=906689 RepID=UPI00109F0D6C|nr:uncharacterized protein LOC110103833 [Dendrobium catenatum]
MKQAGSGEGSSDQQLGSIGRTDQVQSKKIVAPVIKTEGEVKLNKIQAPYNKLKPTHKQSRMDFKQPLLFAARMRSVNRGACKKQTGNYLRSLIRNNEVVFVGLVETMVEDVNRSNVDRLIGNEWDFVHFPAVRLSGGLLALWRSDVTRFELITVMDQVLIGILVFPNDQKWIVAVVYACKDYHGRRTLWDTIGASINAEFSVIVEGDFNCCLDQCEKKGGKRFKYSICAQEMAGFLVDNDLHDLGYLGPKFTWSNNKIGNNKILVRLDRVLMNTEGLRLAPLGTVRHLLCIASDHSPLLLNLSPGNPRPRSKWIRFEDIWMTYPATWKLEWKNWRKEDYELPADVLNQKCQRTLRALFFWSRNRLKELGGLKDLLEGRIQELQMLESSNVGLSEAQDLELHKLAVELNSTLAQMVTCWRQRAKTKWLEEGDANSHFFHSFATARRRGNRIVEVQNSSGEKITEQELIQQEFLEFFRLKWRERQIRMDNWPSF